MSSKPANKQEEAVKRHNLVELKISSLKYDPANPNELSREQMQALRESMLRFGYLAPIIVDKDLLISDGEHRVKVYREFGRDTIPGFIVDFKDDVERRLFRQVANKLHGQHDRARDADEFLVLYEAGKLDDLALLVAGEKEDYLRLLEKYHDIPFVSEDSIPEVPVGEPIVQRGQIWQLGKHRLMCGDALKAGDVKALMADNHVDQILTDPPYGVNYTDDDKTNIFLRHYGDNSESKRLYSQRRAATKIINDSLVDYRTFYGNFLCIGPLNDYNTVYVFSSSKELHNLRLAFEDAEITWGDYLIWLKEQSIIGRKDYHSQNEYIVYGWRVKHKFYGGYPSTILSFQNNPSNELHPTQKPLPLISRLITDGSSKGMSVYDPFGGSGTTLIACEQLNRVCYMMEIEPHYCDVIIQRWEKLTGKKAQLVSEDEAVKSLGK